PIEITGTGVVSSGAIRNTSGTSTISGAVTLLSSASEVQIDSGSSLTLSGGVTGTNLALVVDSAGTSSIAAITTGSGTLTKSGAGTLTLSGANTFTGATTINASGGTLSVTGTLGSTAVYSGAIAIGASSTLSMASNSNQTLQTGVISGDGALTKSGSGTLTLSATNTYTGNTTISAGVVAISNNTALGTTAGSTTVASGAALSLSGSLTAVAEPITVSGTGISSGGAIRNTADSNKITGLVTLAADTEIQSDSGTLTFDPSSGSAITGTFNLTFDANTGNVSVADPIATSTGNVTKSGTGTLTLAGANTYSGTTTINATGGTISVTGTLGASSSPASYAGLITIGSSGTFSYASTSNQTLTSHITGAGAVSKSGTSTLTLSPATASDYTGVTSVDAGVVVVTAASAFGASSAATTVASGAAVHVSGSSLSIAEPFTISGTGTTSTGAIRNLNSAGTDNNTITGAITLGATASVGSDVDTLTFDVSGTGTSFTAAAATSYGLTFVGAGNVTVSDAIVDPITTLTKQGAGTLTMSAANTYTGATTISAGTLNATNNKALGDNDTTRSDTTVANGATLLVSGGLSGLTDPIFLNGPGVGNNGSLLVQGTNTLSGLVTLSTSSEIGADSGATLTLAGGVSGTNVDVTFDGAGNILASGAISLGTGGVTKQGAGVTTLSSASNAY
ncbi:MAG: beta strand repeat-containing protein, partial [Actinomycetota bacterium]